MNQEAKVESNRSILFRPLFVAAALMAGGSAALAVLLNLSFWLRVGRVVTDHQASWQAVFPVSDPGFQETFWQSVRFYLNPLRTHYYLGSAYTWILVIALALLGWYWVNVLRKKERSAVLLLPAVTPVCVGLAILPLKLADIFYALAEQGLSTPYAIGAGTGEATAAIYAGIVLSLVSLSVMLSTRGRRERGEKPDVSD